MRQSFHYILQQILFKVKVSGTDAGEAADTLNAGEIPLNKNDMERNEENILLPHKFLDSFSYIRPPSHKNTLLSLVLFYEKRLFEK